MKSAVIVMLYIFLFATWNILAQGIEIDCGDDLMIQDGVDIQFPTIDPQTTYTVTALGIAGYDPVLAVFNQQQFGSCNDTSLEASEYEVAFPTTGYVRVSNLNASMTFSNNSLMRVVVGDIDNLDGEAVVMVEGLTYDGQPDLVNVLVTESMVESRLPLTAYAIPTTDNLDLMMSLVDDNGVPLLDERGESVECDDAGDNALCWGAHESLLESFTSVSETQFTGATSFSPMLSIPLSTEDVGTIVPFEIDQSPLTETDGIGESYIFVLHFGQGDVGLGDALAEVTTTDDGIRLMCGEQLTLSDAINVTFPRMDAPYTVYALAQGSVNPVIATLTDDVLGVCYTHSQQGLEQSAQLPLAGGFFPSATNARITITNESARILTGLAGDVTGSFLLTVDGMNIPPDGTPDVVSVMVTQSMVESGVALNAYMLARSASLNPQLTLVSAEQEALIDNFGATITCSDTNLPDACWGSYENLNNATLTLSTTDTLNGVSQDVMLTIPLAEEMIGSTLNIMATSADESFGDYVLSLYLTSGTFEDPEASEELEEGE